MDSDSLFAFVRAAFARMPRLQLLYLILFAFTWIVGGNVVAALHSRRLGKPWWSGFRPFAFPFRDYNRWEWLVLGCLAAAAMTFIGLALSLNSK